MMTQAFYTGISGIKTNQHAIDVASNNIANINTVGFRGNTTEFTSVFEKTLNTTSGVSDSVGIGSNIQAVSMQQEIGTIQLTDKSTDLAIMGNGWFGVQGPNKDPEFTRAGNFTFDANSDLVTQDGHYVLGTMGGNITNELVTNILSEVELGDVKKQEKLQFPKFLAYPPQASTSANFIGNLGIDDATRTIGTSIVDVQNNRNHLKLTFTKSVDQPAVGKNWDVVATTESPDGLTIYDTKAGTVNFDEGGALISTTLNTIDNNGTQVDINLGTGYSGVISIANTPITASSSADGTIGGDLVGYEINKNADVIATFTNGMQSSVGKIAVYHFQNDQGLFKLTGTTFSKSQNSGDPLFFQDADGKNIIGTDVANFKLEGSNVDMPTALTELIIYQRSYDANSKSVTTADQMMQKALNMDA